MQCAQVGHVLHHGCRLALCPCSGAKFTVECRLFKSVQREQRQRGEHTPCCIPYGLFAFLFVLDPLLPSEAIPLAHLCAELDLHLLQCRARLVEALTLHLELAHRPLRLEDFSLDVTQQCMSLIEIPFLVT